MLHTPALNTITLITKPHMNTIFKYAVVHTLIIMGAYHAGASTVEELEQAIKRGDSLEQIVAMFDKGEEVNYKVSLLPGKEPAPLICALADDAVYGYSDEYKGLDVPYTQSDAMAALLAKGADPNARDAQGRTPLHLTGHAYAQHILLKNGANPNLTDRQGQKPVVPEAEGIATEGQSGLPEDVEGMSVADIRELGVCYAEGKKGRDVSEVDAIALYEYAAEKGDATAARWMGWRYRQGRGVPKNEETANYYFSKAAAKGDTAAYKAMKELAPKLVAGKTLTFSCNDEKVVAPAAQRDENTYAFLKPNDEAAYVVTWAKHNQEANTTQAPDDKDSTSIAATYTQTGKNTATVTYSFEFSHDGGNISNWYVRTFELIFTSPTEGTATCTVTGKPTTIWADKIIYTGTFSLE